MRLSPPWERIHTFSGLILMHWPKWATWVVVVVLSMVVGAGAALLAKRPVAPSTTGQAGSPQEMAGLDAKIWEREAAIQAMQTRLDVADGEVALERSARLELERQLAAVQNDVGRVREQLAFYEQLLPAGPEGSVAVRGAEFQKLPNGLGYRVLVMRNGKASDTPFVGRLQITASGHESGRDKVKTVTLAPLRDTTASIAAKVLDMAKPASSQPGDDTLGLKFEQYQRLEGVLALPDDFAPETLVVSVLEGKTVRASQSVELRF